MRAAVLTVVFLIVFACVQPARAALRVFLPTSQVWMAYSRSGIPVSHRYEGGRPYRIPISYEWRYPLGELRINGNHVPTMPILDKRRRYRTRTKIQFDASYRKVAIGRNLPIWDKAHVGTGGPLFKLYYQDGRAFLGKSWKEEGFRPSHIRKKTWLNFLCTDRLAPAGYGESDTFVLFRFYGNMDDDQLIIAKMESEQVPLCVALDAGHKLLQPRQGRPPTTQVALVIWKMGRHER